MWLDDAKLSGLKYSRGLWELDFSAKGKAVSQSRVGLEVRQLFLRLFLAMID